LQQIENQYMMLNNGQFTIMLSLIQALAMKVRPTFTPAKAFVG